MDMLLAAFLTLVASIACWMSLGALGARIPLRAVQERRINRRTPGCVLGGQFYQLEEKWSPEIEPRGVMHCVKCECLPVIRKGVLQTRGRIKCRNIKDMCPEPGCDNAVVQTGYCCKSCLGQTKFEDTFSFRKTRPRSEVLKDYSKTSGSIYFSSLLVGRHVSTSTKTTAVAWGQFTLDNGSLRYSIQYLGKNKPVLVRFLDKNGNLLYEHRLADVKSNALICGTWNKFASVFLNYLRSESLKVVIATTKHKRGEIAGTIVKYRIEKTELFLAPLRSTVSDGSGGVALITHDLSKRNVYRFHIMAEGLSEKIDYDPRVIVTLVRKKRLRNKLFHRSYKLSEKKTVTFDKSSMSGRESRWLARGRMLIRIIGSNGRIMQGTLKPIRACAPFQAVLSCSLSPKGARTGAAGAALISVKDSGKIEYKMRAQGLSSRVARVTIESAPNRWNKRRVIEEVTRRYVPDIGSFDGWINGTFRKPKAKDIYLLMHGQLYVTVATQQHQTGEIRGHVTRSSNHNHRAYFEEFPNVLMPLSGTQSDIQSNAAGIAWFGFDNNCILHYEVTLEGIMSRKENDLAVQLSALPENSGTLAMASKHSVKTFEGFTGNRAVGEVRKISEDLFMFLEQGKAILQIASLVQSQGELKSNVTAHNKCWQLFGDHEVGMLIEGDGTTVEEETKYSCRYEGRAYKDGESWIPDVDSVCNTCSCKRGKVKCHKVVCPHLSCTLPTHSPGECCPSCPAVTKKDEKCFFNGDKRWHKVGTTWHPYIPPFGYVTCATCRCQPSPLGGYEVNCTKAQCPPLSCPESEATRVKDLACCKVCPDKSQEEIPSQPKVFELIPQEQQKTDRHMKGACMFGGEVYEDGTKWHPKLASFGVMECVTCRCKDGVRICKKRCREICRTNKANSCCRCKSHSKVSRNNNRQHRRRMRKNRRKLRLQ